MFKIAKTITANNESVDIRIIDVEIGQVEYKNHKIKKQTRQELEISVAGKINKDEYCVHFVISKPITDFFEIEKYEKEKIESEKIVDNYIVVNGIAYLDLIMELEILRFNKELIFSLVFRDCNNNFFGNAEFEISLSKIKNKMKKVSL